MAMLNSRGAIMDPCGVSLFLIFSDMTSAIPTVAVLFDMEDLA